MQSFPGDIMNSYPYRILTGAGLALFMGVVGAQTYGDRPTTMPADKNSPQSVQAQPSNLPNQPSADPATRLPANKDAAQKAQSQPEIAAQPTDKMSGQANAQGKASNQEGRKISSAKSAKSTQHASKSTQNGTKPRAQPEKTAMQGDKAFREALRQCAKEQNQSARDSCLDNAIEQFHHNT
jgi:hypothetical protein